MKLQAVKRQAQFRHPVSRVLNRTAATEVLTELGDIRLEGPHVAKFLRVPMGPNKILTEVKPVHVGAVKPAGAYPVVKVFVKNPSDMGAATDLSSHRLLSPQPDPQHLDNGDPGEIVQTLTADCYYVAPLGSFVSFAYWFAYQLVTFDPVTKLFTGTFFNPANQSVYKLQCTGELGNNGCLPNKRTGAIWGPIMEKLYAWFRTRGADPTYNSLNWGYNGVTLQDTGCTYVNVSPTYQGATAMLAALASNREMSFITPSNVVDGAPLIGSHCYWVLDMVTDSKGNVLTVKCANPWNVDGTGNDGSDDGVITLTWSQLCKNITAVCIVTGYPTYIPRITVPYQGGPQPLPNPVPPTEPAGPEEPTTPPPPPPLPAIPPSPQGVMFMSVTAHALTVNWTNRPGDVAGVRVWRATGSGSYEKVADLPPTVSQFRDTGLTKRTLYYYRVSAWNNAGETSSNSASVRTKAK